MANRISLKSITLIALMLILAFAFAVRYAPAQESGDTDVTTKEQDQKVVQEEAAADEAETMELINEGSPTPSHTRYCEGKYQKKGIDGVEIITVECPDITDTCTCEVTKGNLKKRVNCGGSIKNASEGSEFLDCSSVILSN